MVWCWCRTNLRFGFTPLWVPPHGIMAPQAAPSHGASLPLALPELASARSGTAEKLYRLCKVTQTRAVLYTLSCCSPFIKSHHH